MELVSMREFARRKNVHISTVEKAVKTGRIKRDGQSGKIDFEEQSKNWERNKDTSKIRDEQDRQSIQKPNDLMQAKTDKEIFTAKLKELEYKKESGRLVDKQEVEFVMYKFCKIVRDNLLAIPNRISAEFAAQMITHIKPLIVEHCGNENAEKVIKEIKPKNLENIAYRVWEKESREILENLQDGIKL